MIVYITRNNVREQQFLKKQRFGPHIDCENRARPDSDLMGRKNKMWGGIAVMGEWQFALDGGARGQKIEIMPRTSNRWKTSDDIYATGSIPNMDGHTQPVA